MLEIFELVLDVVQVVLNVALIALILKICKNDADEE